MNSIERIRKALLKKMQYDMETYTDEFQNELAQAAYDAIAEPSETAIQAGMEVLHVHAYDRERNLTTRQIWRAMHEAGKGDE